MRDSENQVPSGDGRKTVATALQNIRKSGSTIFVNSFEAAREILRGDKVRQSGAGADLLDTSKTDEVGLFYLDGEPHRRKRAIISKYFTLKAIETRYQPIIERISDGLLAEFRKQGRACLNDLGFRLAVAVVAEIVGMDYDSDPAGLAARVAATLGAPDQRLPVKGKEDTSMRDFFEKDVLPAINVRRNARKADVISRLLDEGWSDKAVLNEVHAYAVAGMMTTREFIVMATWYVLDQPGLLEKFRTGGRDVQLGIVEEVLRLEPIVGVVRRLVTEDIDSPVCGHIPSGATVAIDLRNVNMDEAGVGACPYAVDPTRAKTSKAGSGFMSFGDGPHRCPGAQLALHETRVFLERLFQVPGLRLERTPDITWYRPIAGYELHDAIVVCDPA